MKRKIFHIIDGLTAGGGQEIVYSLAKYVNDSDTTVISLHGTGQNVYAKKIQSHAPIINLSTSKYNIPSIIWKLFQLIRRNPDATYNFHLEVSTIFGAILKFFLNFKMIVSVHAHPTQFSRLKNHVFYTAMRRADHIIAEDHDVEVYLQRYTIPKSKIHFIPIGSEKVSVTVPPEQNIREELGIPKDAIVLLNIARMVQPKGQADIIRAVELLNGRDPGHIYHAVIIGDGPESEHLKSMAEKPAIRGLISMPGVRMDLHNFYPAADWFIMPAYDESMGLVIYEALGYRVPVIAYRSGSIAEVIHDENLGFLIAPGSSLIAETILSSSSVQRKELLQKADLSYFTADRMIHDYQAVYSRL